MKTCFVVMGFGKKMDYRNAKEVDLDIIYNKVIRQTFEEYKTDGGEEYRVVRADEIKGSDLIDVGMYALLMKADLVIADVTTYNENALYELGIRHALKPASTIIMMQRNDKLFIPFDLNRNRFLLYDEYGENMDDDVAADLRVRLKEFIAAAERGNADSPLYTFLPEIEPPYIKEENCEKIQKIIDAAIENKYSVSAYLKRAEELKRAGKFAEAAKEWEELHKISPKNEYVTQQLAFAHYKSKAPNETMALQKALQIMSTLNPESSLDLETLGITGAIYKRLYLVNNRNIAYLDEAIKMYQKGYIIKNDYYNGENYANCLAFKLLQEDLPEEEKTYLKYSSIKVYGELAKLIETRIAAGETDMWMYATLSTSYYCIGNKEKYEEYKEKFYAASQADWEKDTYEDNLTLIKKCLFDV